jgi:acyl-CoA synthetase (NDP forming)
MNRDLRPLFFPRSCAVVGASEREGSLPGAVLRNLVRGGFPGEVYPVHPKAASVHERRAYADLDALPAVPELALIGIAPDAAEAAIDVLLERGTRAFVLLTAGFGEIGPEGRAREIALAERCRARGAVLMGSNSMGLHTVTPEYRFDGSFSRVLPDAGRIALLCQSGSIGEWLMLRFAERGLGLALFASVGNMADLAVPEFMEGVAALLPRVDQVFLYLETIPEAARLREAAAALRPGTRLVVVRGGTTDSGRRAVGGHTGALAAEPSLAEALLRAVDAEDVASLSDAVDLMETTDRLGTPRGARAVVITNAGGPAVLATDELARMGVELPSLSPRLRERLASGLPPAAVTANPVDMLASATPEAYRDVLTALSHTDEVDVLLPVFMHPIVTDAARVAEVFAEVLPGAPVPALPCWMAAPEAAATGGMLRAAGLPVLTEPDRAARALARWTRRPPEPGPPWPEAAGGSAWPRSAATLPGGSWGDPAVLETFLAGNRARPVPARRASSRDAATRAARELGLPLALKIERGTDPHKARAGLLVLVRTEDELRRGLDLLAARARDDDRWLVQRLVPHGTEVFAAFLRHPELGPFLGLARGGSAVERGEPPVWLSLPTDLPRAHRFLDRVGFLRELPEEGVDAVHELARGMARLAAEAPDAVVAEVNPAVWERETGTLWIVDARWQTGDPGA